MEEQVNIPALGIVCCIAASQRHERFLAIDVPQGKDNLSGVSQFVLERCLEKQYNARLYQTVPQTDTGG